MALKIKDRRKPKPAPQASSALVRSKLNEAVGLHQQGKLEPAIALYSDVLKIEPANFDAIHLLGMIADQMKNHQLAVDLIDQAIAVDPGNAKAHFNRGNALKNLNRFDEAMAGYDRAIALDPRYAEAYNNRGTVLQTLNRLEAALAAYDKAIALNPQYAQAHNNRGMVLQGLDRLEAAIASYDTAVALNPQYVQAHNNRGIALQALKRFDEALVSYSRVVALKPDLAGVHYNMGVALFELKHFDEALASYSRAIALSPGHAEAHSNRGVTLHELARLDASLASFDRAIALKPDFAQAYANRGNVLKDLHRLDKALASYDRAIALKPDYAQAYANRGNVLKDLHRLDEALVACDRAIALNSDIAEAHANRGNVLLELNRVGEAAASYDRAIALNPGYAKAHLNKGLALLSSGDFRNGWPLYEWRWSPGNSNSNPLITSKPRWAGAEQKRVLVWAEQGVGDELMFASMLPELQKRCSSLIVKLDPRLVSLLARSMPKEIKFIPGGEILDEAEYDEHIPMGSLGMYLRPDESSFGAARNGYIVADAERAASIRQALTQGGPPNRKICGISWKSRNEQSGAARSLALRSFVSMLSLPGVDFVSLQYGDTGEEIEQVRSELGIDVRDFKGVDNLNDLDGLASLIQACDVVVSIDNSTVHLAGALGQDTRVLLPQLFNWRWPADRDDSPWYASVTSYKQGGDRNWSGVFEKVKADLSRIWS